MDHIGREYVIRDVLGQDWTVARRTRRVVMLHADWARPQVPDPIEEALKTVDKATMKDAEILRELLRQDHAEVARAAKEGRPPVLIAEKYFPCGESLLKAAMESKRLYKDVTSPEVSSVMHSQRGISHLFLLLLRPAHPEITQEKVDEILDELAETQIAEILLTVTGKAKARPKNAVDPAA